jgi:hypothetical protein
VARQADAPSEAEQPQPADAGLADLQAQRATFEELYARLRPFAVQITVSGTVLRPDIQLQPPFRQWPGPPFVQPGERIGR